jgi:hypothetical protein
MPPGDSLTYRPSGAAVSGKGHSGSRECRRGHKRKRSPPRQSLPSEAAPPEFPGDQRRQEWLRAGRLRLAGLDAGLHPAKPLGVGNSLLLRNPLLPHGLRMRRRPAIGQQLEQIGTT